MDFSYGTECHSIFYRFRNADIIWFIKYIVTHMDLDTLLVSFRNQIDTIDEEILYLLSRRFELVKQIGEIKKEVWEKPLQSDRWKKILNNLYLEWEEKGISKELIDHIWNWIHSESLNIESQ